MRDLNLPSPPPLIGQSPALLAALEHASGVAALERPVLIIGERGTGKELVAARIHFLSQRWDRAYVKINGAALAQDLLESELFGHEAGAFTGASGRHIGRFERADGGTLFLDEIAASSLRAQEKILRVIEYGEFERVGGDKTLSANVRVVAAANVDLPSRAEAGTFRADLLDRLAFDVVTLPPLRARREDIPLLASHFAERMASELGAPSFGGFAPDALATLMAHAWPGNVRELKNVVERAVYRALAADPSAEAPIRDIIIDPFDSPWRPLAPAPRPTPPDTAAPDMARAPSPSSDAGEEALTGSPPPAAVEPWNTDQSDQTGLSARVAALEIGLITDALRTAGGRQTDAAKQLGLTYHQLRGLMRKHAIRVVDGHARRDG